MTRLQWGLPHTNPKPLLQELQQDLALDCLLFTQVHRGSLLPGLALSGALALSFFLPCFIFCSEGLSQDPGADPVTSDDTKLGLPSFSSPSLTMPQSISFPKTPYSR